MKLKIHEITGGDSTPIGPTYFQEWWIERIEFCCREMSECVMAVKRKVLLYSNRILIGDHDISCCPWCGAEIETEIIEGPLAG